MTFSHEFRGEGLCFTIELRRAQRPRCLTTFNQQELLRTVVQRSGEHGAFTLVNCVANGPIKFEYVVRTSQITGSMKTSRSPAHEKPISQASSSPSLISTSRDLNDESACSDSAITRASTQPPIVTDPRMRPSSPTHIFAPSRFGLVPRVATSVAMATRFSARASFSMSSNSSSIAGNGNLGRHSALPQSPKSFLDRVSIGSGSDLVSDQHSQ